MSERVFHVLYDGHLVGKIWTEQVEEHVACMIFRRGPIVAWIEKGPKVTVVEHTVKPV